MKKERKLFLFQLFVRLLPAISYLLNGAVKLLIVDERYEKFNQKWKR